MNFGDGVKKTRPSSQPFLVPKGLCYGVDLSVSETETQRRIRAEARHFTTKKSGLRICGTAAARDNSG